MESDAPAVCGKIGFITDCEGNYEYWQASVALSDVVGWDSDGELAFINDPEKDGFVFGGDVFDKGTGRIYERDRVTHKLGNIDIEWGVTRYINKLGDFREPCPQLMLSCFVPHNTGDL